MKDLITTIGAITILMLFVIQFANNQAIATKIIAADALCDQFVSRKIDKVELGEKLSQNLNCSTEDVIIEENENGYTIKGYINKVIACADFLGITEEENRAEYKYFSAKKKNDNKQEDGAKLEDEEPNNNFGNNDAYDSPE